MKNNPTHRGSVSSVNGATVGSPHSVCPIKEDLQDLLARVSALEG